MQKEPESGWASRLSPPKPWADVGTCPSSHHSHTPSLLFLESCTTGHLQVLRNVLKAEESTFIYGLTESRDGKCL